MEQLEKMENDKKRLEREQREREIREKEEKKKREEELEKLKSQKIKSLPNEPEQGNLNATHIILRYPDGNRRAERRFLKTDTIQVKNDI